MINNKTILKPTSEIKYLNDIGKKHIAVIAGGMSAERDISLSSAEGVTKAIMENGYKVTLIDMGMDIASVLSELKPDIVFNCLHGTYGEDGCLPGMLNIMHIPYTYSGVLASSLAFNKVKSMELFTANNIDCAKTLIVNKKDKIKGDPLPRPYIIKPVSQGSSIGVIPVFEGDDFDFADYDFPYGDQVIVEEFISGREMQIAVLNGKALGVLEIKLLKNQRIYDYDTKYTEGLAGHILPAILTKFQTEHVMDLSEKVYNLLGCRGIVRVEFMYNDEKDKFYILEANTHPGMTPLSICPEIAAYRGINFNELIETLIKDACYE